MEDQIEAPDYSQDETIKVACPHCMEVLILQRRLDLKGRIVEVHDDAAVALCYRAPGKIWSCPTKQWGSPGTRFDYGEVQHSKPGYDGPSHVVQVQPPAEDDHFAPSQGIREYAPI